MQKKFLTAAAASALAAVGSAHAVDKAELGSALIVPYYTTEVGNETYFHVTNTTDETKALKVRFREGQGSEDSLDFHVYLSPFDMWSAALTQKEDGTPTLVTSDTSCTVPGIARRAVNSQATVKTTYLDEIDSVLAGLEVEGGDRAPANERIREGYIEIIEMATIEDGAGNIGWAADHGTDGVPNDCSVLTQLNELQLYPGNYSQGLVVDSGLGVAGQTATTFEDVSGQLNAPGGGLFASAAIMNVEDASYFPMDVTTLDTITDENWIDGPMFFSQNQNSPDGVEQFTADRGLVHVKSIAGAQEGIQLWDLPDLSTAVDAAGDVSGGMGGSSGTAQIERVTAALQAETIHNEFMVDPDVNGKTDWVVTMPTKRFHVTGEIGTDGVVNTDNDPVRAPFTSAFNYADAQSEEAISVRVWDREEQELDVDTGSDVGFSPGIPDAVDGLALLWETNVFTIGDEPNSVLGSNTTSGTIPTNGKPAGFISMNLANEDRGGLPVIGFAAWQYVNTGEAGTGVLSNYGGSFRHRVMPGDID